MAQLRIPKFLHVAHFGFNGHQAEPCPPVGVAKVPMAGWLVFFLPIPSPYIYGKYSSQRVETEGMYNTLFGHDWGPLQPHLCVAPPTHVTTPSTIPVNLGSGHKFWMPSYSVKEPASGGLLAKIGGSATTAVAVCAPSGVICIQDCMDRGGIGFVLPIGINFALPTTHWVGFTSSDFWAGAAALAFDCIGAIILSRLSNGRMFSKYGDVTKAFIGLGIGIAGAALQGLMSRFNAPPWLQVTVGIILIGVDFNRKVKLDHTGPAGAGLMGGGIADLIGGQGTSGDARGDHDPFFDPPPTATPPPTTTPPPPTPPPATPPPSSTPPSGGDKGDFPPPPTDNFLT